jgi:hypothetical protein
MTDKELYQLGELLELCYKGASLITSSRVAEKAFRYKKVVDYSDKGFLCSQAIALKKLLDIEGMSSSSSKQINSDYEEISILTTAFRSHFGSDKES